MKPVRVIGGGFSGLSVAYFLARRGLPVEVFEQKPALGGLIGSSRTALGLVESAANGLLSTQLLEETCDELGVELVASKPENKKRYIYRNGRMRRWPLGIGESLRLFSGAAYFTFSGKLKPGGAESLSEWSTRRFGRAAFDYLLSPAASGVFGTGEICADLARKAMGRGGLGRGRLQGLVAPRAGMGELIAGFIKGIDRHGGVMRTDCSGVLEPDYATILATDASAASVLLAPTDAELAHRLRRVRYVGLTTATLFYDQHEKVKGFGCLFPRMEKFNALGVLFNSDIFPYRARVRSETWILPYDEGSGSGGGDGTENVLHKISEDRARLPLKKVKPVETHVTHWPRAIPLYNKELADILRDLREPYRVYLHGNYLGELGLARLLARSERLAERIANEYTGF